MTVRWTFADDGETYTVPINPDSMTSPTRDKNFEHAFAGVGGQVRARSVARPGTAKEWEFSGVIRTREHHDALEHWVKKPGKVRITDHLGRVFEVMFQTFEPTDRPPTRSTPWRLRYTVKALLLRRIS